MSTVKLGRFRSQIEASCTFSHTEELGYNKTVCLDDDNIYVEKLIIMIQEEGMIY